MIDAETATVEAEEDRMFMAEIVAAVGLPHTPYFPAMVSRDDPENATSQLFANLARRMRAARVDTIVMFDSDHFNTFFLENWPTFAIGVAAQMSGPNDGTAGLASRSIDIPLDMAHAVRDHTVDSGFDLAVSQHLTIDHSIMVPLHYLETDAAVLPVFVNGMVPPLPKAQRCAELGRTVVEAVRDLPGDHRVALVASGSFSIELGGPRLEQGKLWGVPDKKWAARTYDYLQAGDVEGLIAEATPEQLSRAGNVGGELLNWIAVAAATQGAPEYLEAQEDIGHAFAWWDMAGA